MTELYAQAVTASHRERWTRERTDVQRRFRRRVRRGRRRRPGPLAASDA